MARSISETFEFIVNHVFMPIQLPQHYDCSFANEYELCHVVYRHALACGADLIAPESLRWGPTLRMLERFAKTLDRDCYSPEDIRNALNDMQAGDTTIIFVRAQNACLMIKKRSNDMLFESFEVSARNEDILATAGKLRRTFPGPAIVVPNDTADDPSFRTELASFLSLMNTEVLDSAATSRKAGVHLTETRNTAHPRYITQLLTGILRGMGQPADILRVEKRIGDDVLWKDAKNPWRRSPVWTVIRVALQTSLVVADRKKQDHRAYKCFMVSLMMHILELAIDEHHLTSDVLHCMRTKLARRLHKLGNSAPEALRHQVIRVEERVEDHLQRRWLGIQTTYSSHSPWAPATLDIYKDSFLTLRNSSNYLQRALRGLTTEQNPTPFSPKPSPRLFGEATTLLSFSPDAVKQSFTADPPVALYDFEKAVRENIDGWVVKHSKDEWAVEHLSRLLIFYHEAASSLYQGNPEDLSLMVLSLLDLWMAIDKLSVFHCPLLTKYSPEIPLALLEPLLLRTAQSLGRLTAICSHLTIRHQQAEYANPSIFSPITSRKSFAVRFFETSSCLRTLKTQIEHRAETERLAKETEFSRLISRKKELSSRADSIEHRYTYTKGLSKHKQKSCPKCRLEKEIQALKITVHEWPLPVDRIAASNAVFELQCPSVFRIWRDTTYHLLYDVCNDQPVGRNPEMRVSLQNYVGLKNHQGQFSRITIASSTKSFYNTHYKLPQSGSADLSQVCLPCGLQFALYDTERRAWAKSSASQSSVTQYCTIQLPPAEVYSSLQFAVNQTSHTPNQVLAEQYKCPRDLSLHEFDAFVSLRSGHRVQWLNILRELRTRSLTFRKEEVHILLMQAAWQIGPISAGRSPEAHSGDLPSVDFGLALLEELERLQQDISANWLEIVTAKSIVMLVSRLLAVSPVPRIAHKSYQLLRETRTMLLKWVRELAKKLDECVEEKQIDELRYRVCEASATCRMTFDVDESHLSCLLRADSDVSEALECAIRIYDNMPGVAQMSEPHFKRVLERDRRLSVFLEHRLKRLISLSRGGVDNAVSVIWPAYRPGALWHNLASPDDRWIATTTVGSQVVHLDTISGRLLIDGQPAGRLGRDILQHETYVRLFRNKVLDVVPAEMRGMQYASRSPVGGYQLFFALIGEDLIIRAKQESVVLELIPHVVFRGDLPASFVEECVHWLCLSHGSPHPHGSIELRPLDDPWAASDSNWTVNLSLNDCRSQMCQKEILLIDIQSASAAMVHRQLEVLESRENLHIFCHRRVDGTTLSVTMPRYRLHFVSNERGDLESTQFSGMIVDSHPSTGTMVGLVNQLVLRPKNTQIADLARTRRVLIPQGTVIPERIRGHTRVRIDPPAAARIVYHEYEIDNVLGCLISKPSLFDKLYQAYLHALTSYCLPDPLTGRTGVEEALHILQSGSSFSFTSLSLQEVELLLGIDSLTPRFTYYPLNLKTMQSVQWLDNISILSGSPLFFDIARKIYEHATDLSLFDTSTQPQGQELVQSTFPSSECHLVARYGARYRHLFPSETMSFPTSPDFPYSARDVIDTGSEIDSESKACALSKSMSRWSPCLDVSPKLDLFNTLTRLGSVHASSQPLIKCSDWLGANLCESWFRLFNTLRQASVGHRFHLAFGLNILLYRSHVDWDLIPTLVAIATNPAFSALHPPSSGSSGLFDFSVGFEPQLSRIATIINQSSRFDIPTSLELTRSQRESLSTFHLRCTAHEERVYSSQANQLATILIKQWPCLRPSAPRPPGGSALLFQQAEFMDCIRPLFASLYHNLQFRDHIQGVQRELNAVRRLGGTTPLTPYHIHVAPTMAARSYDGVRLQSLLDCLPAPSCPELPHVMGHEDLPSQRGLDPLDPSPLTPIIRDMANSEQRIHQVYAEDLQMSQRLLSSQATQISLQGSAFLTAPFSAVANYSQQCDHHLHLVTQIVTSRVAVNNIPGLTDIALARAGLWPRLTPMTLLRLLAPTSLVQLTPAWKGAIVSLAQALLLYQRSQRLIRLHLREAWDEFAMELANTHTSSGFLHPDWLLIQIEGNFMARSLQVHVAEAMINPPSENSRSSRNIVLQLNMGEGKSSVIVPFVAAEVANGDALCRVVVLKPLAGQMFRQLFEKLSGLANRRIYSIPFSRKIIMGPKQVATIKKLFRDCVAAHGVFLAQPEHILSFKLMTVDKLLHAYPDDYRPMLNCSRWLSTISRDLLDESDEILETRYQLIYTVGQQIPLEDNPSRWITIQHIFDLVEECLRRPQSGIEMTNIEGRFPFIRSLESAVGAELIGLVSTLIISAALPGLPFTILSSELQSVVLQFITEVEAVNHYDRLQRETGGFWKGVLLLRGLLAHGILLYVLKERRWRVDYGLDLNRTLLAVPYRAKDVPALRAEFGHPEVAICLTCLAYYYSGLSENQLRLCFELLSRLDSPDVEYTSWTRRDSTIPLDLRDLRSINIEDADQWSSLMDHYAYNKATIDFFLRGVVFPKEGKSFPQKLCTSGWDLAESKVNVTTGFSGTNDNRYLLPTSIKQHDLEILKSTNAKVLNFVLLSENNYYQCARTPDGRVLVAIDFLRMLSQQEPAVRVLLDVGAQMLELQNIDLARSWLKLQPHHVEAAVFFDEDDEIMVISRDGDLSSFYGSPYFHQLDRCVVYLDDAHTRGTDLKLPRGTRAAVTLGPKVTKDRLIQGCMRMRKLGNGHTVMFFAPPEVDACIRRVVGKISADDTVQVSDVLRWAMHETCSRIEHNMSHWFSQGVNYSQRRVAWDEFLKKSNEDPGKLRSAWLQPEAQTLEEMYGPRYDISVASPPRAIETRLENLGLDLSVGSSRTVDEEQEREVSHEVELEREVQRPNGEVPAKHCIHPAVRLLIETGTLDHSDAFVSVMKFFRPSNKLCFKVRGQEPRLFATRDFMFTVASTGISPHSPSDYLRPIKWIVHHHATESLIIFSPWEVNKLLPLIRQAKGISLHLYSPRVALSMRPFDDLRVYSVPTLPPDWTAPTREVLCLNLIAGQVYLRDYNEYLDVCLFLGRYSGKDDKDTPKEIDGFIQPEHRSEAMEESCAFTQSPISPLKALVSARRKGLDYRTSHLGKILNSAVLRPEDF